MHLLLLYLRKCSCHERMEESWAVLLAVGDRLLILNSLEERRLPSLSNVRRVDYRRAAWGKSQGDWIFLFKNYIWARSVLLMWISCPSLHLTRYERNYQHYLLYYFKCLWYQAQWLLLRINYNPRTLFLYPRVPNEKTIWLV